MNTINDELVYKVYKLHDALNCAQKTVALLEQENSYLKQQILGLSHNRDIFKSCLDIYIPEPTGNNHE